MAIESKNLLVWVKAMSRGQALPLDASEVWESKAEAEAYAAGIANSSTVAYVGQTLKVKEKGSIVATYVIENESGDLLRLTDEEVLNDAIDTINAAIAAIPAPEAISDEEIEEVFALVFPEEVNT